MQILQSFLRFFVSVGQMRFRFKLCYQCLLCRIGPTLCVAGVMVLRCLLVWLRLLLVVTRCKPHHDSPLPALSACKYVISAALAPVRCIVLNASYVSAMPLHMLHST